MRWVSYRWLTTWTKTVSDLHFTFETNSVIVTVKEVTKVNTANSLNGGRGTMCGKISWKGDTCSWCPPKFPDKMQGRGLGTRLGMWSYMHSNILHRSYLNYTFAWRQNTECLPMIFMLLLWSGSIPIPSWHKTVVPLRSGMALTVAVDVIDPVITSMRLNWNGGSEITLPWSRGRRDWIISWDGTSHRCASEDIVHVNITLSPGHGLSTLDCNSASETKRDNNTL